MTRVPHIQTIATGGRPPEAGYIHHSQILQRSVFGACLGESGAFDEIQCSVFSSRIHHSDPEPNWYIYHSDHLGSSAFLTDAAGDPTQHLQYMPFGEPFIEQRSITSYYTPYTFSAKERDTETGYSYFGARYYDADISVWLSVDPMADKAPGWTPYRYCFQNPINHTDFSGLLEDGYTVDEWGNFEKVDNTGGEEYDVIYKKADYLAGKREYDRTGTKSGIQVDKSILKSQKTINIELFDRDGRDTGERLKNHRYEIKTDGEATKLFEFLANNTKVEWSNKLFFDPKTKRTINVLNTSHEEGTISAGTHVVFKYTDKGYLVKRADHNHPSGSPQPSEGDRESAALYKATSDVKYRIYAKGRYHNYLPKK